VVKPYVRVPEAQRRPIIQHHPVVQPRQVAQPRQMPAASGFSPKQPMHQQIHPRNGRGGQSAAVPKHRG
jgi:hypothetical protein